MTKKQIQDAYPLSYTQMGMLFHHQMHKADAVYHDIVIQQIALPLNIDVLQQVIDDLVSANEILRTTLELSRFKQSLQVVHSAMNTAVTLLDLSHAGPEEYQNAKQQWIEAEKQRGFELESASLFRVFAIARSESGFELALSFHHALLDGYSVRHLTAELLRCYDLVLQGHKYELAHSPARYRDFIAAERQAIDSESTQQYWQTILQGYVRADIDSAASQSAATAHLAAVIPLTEETADQLENLRLRLKVSHKAVLLAAHLKAIAVLSGKSDVLTGVVVNGRPEKLGAESVLGLFLNTVPFRAQVVNQPWTALVQQVAACDKAMLPHRRYPLGLMKKQHDGAEFFQHIFNYTSFNESIHVKRQALEDVRGFEKTNYPFTVQATFNKSSNRPEIFLELDGAVYAESDLQRFVNIYQAVLAQLASNPDAACTLLKEAEDQHKTLPEFTADTIVEMFRRSCDAHADAPALTFADTQLSYRQLDEASNKVANGLLAKGLQPGQLVGVCLQHSEDLLIALLAVLKAGAAYVPLDPNQALERQNDILADAAPAAVLVQAKVAGWDDTVTQYTLAELPDDNPQAPASSPAPQDLAYVLYTSGSTGRPNGVQVTHNNVCRLFKSSQDWFGFDHTDVWTLFHSYAFDFSVWEIWGALFYGGRLVIPQRAVTRDPAGFAQLVCREGVTVLNQTPTAFNAVMPHLLQAADTHRLRHVVFGGEALELHKLLPWFDAGGACAHTRLVNMYGITETTVHVTYRPLSRQDCADKAVGSLIGEPLPDLDIQLLDEWQQPVPLGVPGEIYVCGAGVSKGYLNRSALTAERFVKLAGSEQLWYRSGDIARRLQSGEVEYLGRRDHQVKIRGHRVELGDISRQLLKHEGIEDAVVLMRNIAGQESLLTAYYTGQYAEPPVLGAHLHRLLPEYMVPVAYVRIEQMPLTINGKLDQRALPEPCLTDRVGSAQLQAPASELEALLCGIWQEVLGLDEIGTNLGFTALGGDSISSLQVVGKLRKQGYVLSLQDLFQYQTIAGLAGHIQPVESEQVASQPFDLIAEDIRSQLPADIEDAYPVSLLQQGMLYYSQRSAGDGVYHDIVHYQPGLQFDEASLRKTLDLLARRHAMLRTEIALDRYAQPLLLVHKAAQIELQVYAVAQDKVEPALQGWLQQEHQRGFAAEDYPLLRVAAHVLPDGLFHLSFSNHHAIVDGLSEASLIAELLSVYRQVQAGKSVELPVLQASYRDFIAMEQQALADARHPAFWQHLESATASRVQLAAAHDAAVDEYQQSLSLSEAISCSLGASLSAGLRQLAADSGYSLKTLLLAAHLKTLSLACASDTVVSGGSFHGRPEVIDSEKVLGLFVSILPVCVTLPSGDWLSLVKAVDTHCRAIEQHRFYPLAEIKRRLAGHALFDVSFNYTQFNVLWQEDSEAGTQLNDQRGGVAENSLPFNINVQSYPDRDEIYLSVETLRSHYAAGVGLSYSRLYRQVLAQLVANPAQSHHLVFTESLLQRELAEFTADTIVEMFRRSCDAHADAPALTFADTQLSYRQLDEASNKVANGLLAKGLQPGQLVGVCLQHSEDLLIALLAVLKAGAAYVPLDPNQALERQNDILADAAPAAVLVQAKVAGWDDTVTQYTLAELPDDNPQAPASSPAPQDLAYVLYTSGSTGRPNGVQVTHNNVCRLFKSSQDWFGFDHTDVWTLFHSYAFDFSVWEIWGALFYGGRLVIPQRAVTRDPAGFAQLVCREGVTVLNQTPTAFNAVMPHLLQAADTHRLRHVVFGGEALELHKLLPWFDAGGACAHTRLVNMYGITETTVHVTYRPLSRQDCADKAVGSLIGEPLPDLDIQLLDEWQQPVPLGVPGEIYVCGAGVSKGYLNRSALTAERFVKLAGSEQLWYRSGDIARRLQSGEVEYLGRRDHQVKIRGHRVELGDISRQLLKHEGIEDAVVLMRNIAGQESLLTAYYTGQYAEPPVLGAHLHRLLPEYMVPVAYVRIEQMPLTINGKLDQRALPEPCLTDRVGSAQLQAPASELEALLCGIWQEVLGLDEIGTNLGFTALGGDSISSLQVVGKLRKQGYVLSLQDLFQYQTIAGLAGHIQPVESEQVASQPFDLIAEDIRSQLPADIEDAYPVSLLQQGMLYYSQRSAGDGVYHDIVHYQPGLQFDEASLRKTLDLLARRHAMLRTEIALDRYAQPLLLVHKAAQIELQVYAVAQDKVEPALQGWLQQEHQRGFAAEDYPLLRVAAHVLPDGLFHLSFSNHHAIVDGLSEASLIAELLSVYRQVQAGKSVELPVLQASYRDFIAMEQQALADARHPAFWQHLESATASRVQLAAAHDAAVDEYQQSLSLSEAISCSLGASLSAGLRQLAADSGYSLKTLLLAAHLKTLSLACASDTVVSGGSFHGRPEVIDSEKVLGLFVSILPVCVTLPSGDWLSLVKAVDTHCRAIEQHRFYPLAEIKRRLAGHALFDVSFNYTQFNVLWQEDSEAGTQLNDQRGGVAENSLPFNINVQSYPDRDEIYLSVTTLRSHYAAGVGLSYSRLYRQVLA
ncbi:amino acid adenylation domain-containing protein, partial [Rheinheimera pacifica]|uniref:non-ribosomal peptide synthetase n=1 Tax=Rheinheimera pacifica TaxID=173990 RepID=UPI002861AECF